MHWLSFFIGLLVGWLAEWLIDYFFWRRRSSAPDVMASGLREKLTNIQAENEQLRSMWQQAQITKKDLTTCLDELQSQNNEAKQLGDSLAAAQAEIESLHEELAATSAVASAEAEGQIETEDMDSLESDSVVRESIGEEQESSDLSASLADDPIDQLGDTVRSDEMELAVAIADEPIEPDNLKKIEGIGPKIAGILNENSIWTFAQLAQADVVHLKVILENAGPRFRLANPATWPEQAQMAAAGEWDNLKALQDRLKHGRHAE
jgi:predicted flap endonuclease-1-like 5' DNA nuclease